MIRVNLLPHSKKKERGPSGGGGGSQRWLIVLLALLVVEVVGLVVFHQTMVGDYEDQMATNGELKADIADIKSLVANHEEVKKELVELRAREDAIADLQKARSGPTAALLEIAQLLTPGKGPTADPDRIKQLQRDNPLQVYNPGWDSRRLWLTAYREIDGVVMMEGQARDSADVSEFAYRLKLSSYFYDVRLLPGEKTSTAKNVEVVDFAIELKVRY